MENASKALIMAGGILIGVLTISILVFGYTKIREAPIAQEREITAEQLAKFNIEYESYNKQAMYGTDVISVLNKAISNNEKYGVTNNPNDYLYIDVSFRVTEDITQTRVRYVSNNQGQTYNVTKSSIEIIFKKDKDKGYALSRDYNEIKKFFEGPRDIETITDNELGKKYTYDVIYPAFSDFKRSIFKCTDIIYNQGKVSKISFEQVSKSEYID